MAELVIKIPEDLKREIDRTPFIDWSKVAKQKRVMPNLLTKNAFSFDRNFEQYGFSLLRV